MEISTLLSGQYKLDTGLKAGARVCAIGDVHGNAKHLAVLLDMFEADNDKYDKTTLVFLGDLIDRGSENLVAIDLAIKAKTRFDDVIGLQGNHEAMMRLVITPDMTDMTATWNKYGGQDVLNEIGMSNLDFSNKENFRTSLRKHIGTARIEYLENMLSHHTQGNLLFVHAGTHPHKSLKEHFAQPWYETFGEHWCWIRDIFLSHPVQFENLVVVHGHTPVSRRQYRNPDLVFAGHVLQGGKINLDGGSYASGCVTGAEFCQDNYRLYSALVYR